MEKAWHIKEDNHECVVASHTLRHHESIGLALKKKPWSKPEDADPWLWTDLAIHVRDSKMPNCYVYSIKDKLFYVAARVIQRNEELTVSYDELGIEMQDNKS